jgi:hypothetical protein
LINDSLPWYHGSTTFDATAAEKEDIIMAKKYFTVTLTLPDGTRRYYRGNTKKEAEAHAAAAALELLHEREEAGEPLVAASAAGGRGETHAS